MAVRIMGTSGQLLHACKRVVNHYHQEKVVTYRISHDAFIITAEELHHYHPAPPAPSSVTSGKNEVENKGETNDGIDKRGPWEYGHAF